MCFVGNEDKEGGRFEIYFGNITTRWMKNEETTKSVINYLPRCTHHLIYFGHQVFYLFCPLVLIFGHIVFIYSVVQFRYNVTISLFKVCVCVCQSKYFFLSAHCLFVSMSLCLFVWRCLSVFLSVCLSVCLPVLVCTTVCPPVSASVCLCLYLCLYQLSEKNNLFYLKPERIRTSKQHKLSLLTRFC